MQPLFSLLQQTVFEWQRDKVPRLGAALAYYTVFALVPLLIILVTLSGFIFGQATAEAQLLAQVQSYVGADGAQFIRTLVESPRRSSAGDLPALFGISTLVVGAFGLFNHLQDALNSIWQVEPKPGRTLGDIVHDRAYSLLAVILTWLLLFLLLVASTLIAVLAKSFESLPLPVEVLEGVNLLVSLALSMVLFAWLFKELPDVQITWKHVVPGALITALLFTVGKFAIGLYLANSGIGSTFGAAGSLVALLVWIYYSAQIFFFGAAFTHVYTKKYEAHIAPTPNAMRVGK